MTCQNALENPQKYFKINHETRRTEMPPQFSIEKIVVQAGNVITVKMHS